MTALPAAPAAGQDIEAVAEIRGIPVPAGYYETIARDPSFFTLPNGLFRIGPEGRAAARSTGVARLPVVLALFADSPEPHVGRDLIQRSLFDGPTERGTVTEAYLEMSRGALDVRGDVFEWVRTSIPMTSAVGTSSGLGEDANLGPYFLEALGLVDAEVDFGLYDSDGPDGVPNSGDDDGYVDALTFEFLEVSGSCGGPSIWPHRSGLARRNQGEAYATDDLRPDGSPVLVDGYIVQGATECDGQTVQAANVIAHEFGHVLGLPDFYHPVGPRGPEWRRWVLGCWELMAAGSWGCGPVLPDRAPFGPTHMSAVPKATLGWVDFVDPGEVWDTEIWLDPVQTSGRALAIPLDAQGVESLYVSYRARQGFDTQLPADGVLVFHGDGNGELRPDTASTTPYRLALVEADNDDGLRRPAVQGGDRGVAGDAWGVGGVVRTLHSGTLPGTRLNSGAASSVAIHEIALEGGRARIRLSTGPTPRLSPPAEPFTVMQVAPFDVRVRVGGGLMPYEFVGTPPDGIGLFAFGDELVVSGSVVGTEPVELVARVRDAAGTESPPVTVTIVGGEAWTVDLATLLQTFLRSDARPLAPGELAHLDALGNDNGRYDVGDLRRWLREEELSARVRRR